ncbi:MAG: IS110 family transposase [Proteobacteria bacterium]|nr:IS110 family transposase [Pseudomonadota bacterium]
MNLAGIDVANETFDIQKRGGEAITHRIFPNTKSGHQQAITWLRGGSKGVRVCLEATGIYHLQLALALDRAPGIELMVLNPKAARRFAEAQMVRGKTDKVDAMVLLNYLERMLFRPWSAPDEHRLVLQSMAHRLAQLTKEQVRERSRLHAAERAGPHTREAKHDIRVHIRYLKRRYQQLETKAIELMKQHATMAEDLKLIDTVPGFAETAAMQVLAEVGVLPGDLQPQQWVAQAGLDPKPGESGTSVHSPRHISKQGNAKLRAALFYPSMSACRCDPNVQAFYEKLLARGKSKRAAQTAVMRKLLHSIWAIMKYRQPWDGNKFYRITEQINT